MAKQPGLFIVERGKAGIDARDAEVLAHHAPTPTVQRADIGAVDQDGLSAKMIAKRSRQIGRGDQFVQLVGDAHAQLGRRGAREGHHQQLIDVAAVVADQRDAAAGQHLGLAGSGRSTDQQVASTVFDRGCLIGRQVQASPPIRAALGK